MRVTLKNLLRWGGLHHNRVSPFGESLVLLCPPSYRIGVNHTSTPTMELVTVNNGVCQFLVCSNSLLGEVLLRCCFGEDSQLRGQCSSSHRRMLAGLMVLYCPFTRSNYPSHFLREESLGMRMESLWMRMGSRVEALILYGFFLI